MEQVQNYYKDRVNTGEWMKLDEDQETILALKAQHWCTGHKEWTIHTSAECRINKNKDAKKEKKTKREKAEGSEKSEQKGKKQLTLKVLQTIADHVQEGEDSESCYSP